MFPWTVVILNVFLDFLDFPTLSQEQRYFFLYLFAYESQVFVTWSLLEERGPWELVFVCGGPLYPSRVLSVGKSFRLVFSV